MFRQLANRASPLPQTRVTNGRGLNDPKLLGRATMVMFTMGGFCGAGTLLFANDPNLNRTLGWSITASAFAMVLLLWRWGEKMPDWFPPYAAAFGTAVISLAIAFGGSIGGVVFPIIYIWGGLYSFAFFSTRVAIAEFIFIAVGFSTAATISQRVPWIFVVMVLGTILGQSPFVRYLVGEIVELSRVDPLTGIANRRAFDEQMEYTRRDSRRSERSNAIIMLDIDFFKQFNDNRGHLDGDQFLCDVTKAWVSVLRDSDLLARFGGEEFIVLLRDCPMEGAMECADRLRAVVPAGMTCSAGVGVFQHGEEYSQLLARTDLALYEAKDQGRNRTIAAPEKLPPDVDVTAQSSREAVKSA